MQIYADHQNTHEQSKRRQFQNEPENVAYTSSLKRQWRNPGGRRRRAPPYGSRFFRFDIQIFQNVATSGVGAPPPRGRHPPHRKS